MLLLLLAQDLLLLVIIRVIWMNLLNIERRLLLDILLLRTLDVILWLSYLSWFKSWNFIQVNKLGSIYLLFTWGDDWNCCCDWADWILDMPGELWLPGWLKDVAWLNGYVPFWLEELTGIVFNVLRDVFSNSLCVHELYIRIVAQ